MLNILFSFGKYVDDGCQVIPLSLRDSYGLRHKLVVFPHIEYKVREAGVSQWHKNVVATFEIWLKIG